MVFSPVFENQASKECKKYYSQLKQAFEVRKLPLFFYLSGNFPEFLKLTTPQIITNLKNPKFNKLISEVSGSLWLSFENYELSEKFDEIFKESAKIYKKEIDSLFLIILKMVIFLYAIRETIKGFVFGIKNLPSSTTEGLNSDFKNFSSESDGNLQSVSKEIFRNETLVIKSADSAIVKRVSSLPILPFPQFLKRAEDFFLEEIKKESFVIYRLGVEKLFLNFINLLPEKIELNYKTLLQSLKKYYNYERFIPLLAEDFPVTYVYKLLLLLFLKLLSTST